MPLRNSLPEPAISGSTLEKILENREEVQRLQRVMNLLTDETREILMLRFHQECSVKEVARIFSISESAVKMRTSRGLQQLQGLMQENSS
jgi:RNA polymerase sigma-70 factor (ECF subfamily)